jgi:fructoselysine 3-epimerase
MIKTSISTAVHYRYSLEEAIRRYARMGYDQVEIWAGRPHAYCDDMTDKAVRRLRDVLEETGLDISSWIPAQFRYPTNLAAQNETVRAASVDYIKKSIDAAARSGSPRLSICPGYSLIDKPFAAAREAMLKSFAELVEFAGNGTGTASSSEAPVLLIEPGNSWETDLIVTVQDAIEVIKDLGSPKNLGLVVDTGHCHINQEPLADIPRIVQGLPIHYHIDDNRGVSDDHLVPGRGIMNFDAFLAALGSVHYEGALTVELGFGYTVDPDPAAMESLQWLQENLPKAGQ